MEAYPKLIGFDELAARFSLRPFYYSAYYASLAAGANTTITINVQENTAYAIARLQSWVHKVADPTTAGYCNLLLTDAGTGRKMFDRALPANLLTGFYMNEASWIAPYIMAGNSTLTIDITSIEAANAITVWVVLFGVHMYNKVSAAPVQVSPDGLGLIV